MDQRQAIWKLGLLLFLSLPLDAQRLPVLDAPRYQQSLGR